MQNAWTTIVGSCLLFATAACGELADRNVAEVNSRQTVDETEPSEELGYGWKHDIEATEDNGLEADYTLSEIVTSSKVNVRADGKSCVSCHSWAKKQDAESFCKRVNAFLSMPTAKGTKADPKSAKPANLKKLLRDWKEAGCPE